MESSTSKEDKEMNLENEEDWSEGFEEDFYVRCLEDCKHTWLDQIHISPVRTGNMRVVPIMLTFARGVENLVL